MEAKFRRLTGGAAFPSYAHEGDAGLDLRAVERTVLKPGRATLVGTGIAVELPTGTEGQVRPLSGLALKHSVTVLNAPGTVDEGYRGEVGVILINHGGAPFVVEAGMRVAQLVVASRLRVGVVEVEELGASERGTKGFGSSDVRGGGGVGVGGR